MENENVTKILNVWETNNKIRNPVKNELYLDIIDQVASLFAAGSYYYYILNLTNLEMEFVHLGIKKVLEIQPNEFSINKLFQLMHPEDLAKMTKKEKVQLILVCLEI
jgi:hypothetical protein